MSITIESICNQALDKIGYKRHIGSIYEGTPAARIALDNWGTTRDSLLSRQSPMWAHKDAVLTLAKSAPAAGYGLVPWTSASPPLPWLYEYTWPTDCIMPLQIKSTPLFLPIYRPRAIPFRVVFDAVNAILTNEPNAILVYIAQVLDPTLWYNDFQDAMILELAKVFAPELAPQQPKEQGNARPNASG